MKDKMGEGGGDDRDSNVIYLESRRQRNLWIPENYLAYLKEWWKSFGGEEKITAAVDFLARQAFDFAKIFKLLSSLDQEQANQLPEILIFPLPQKFGEAEFGQYCSAYLMSLNERKFLRLINPDPAMITLDQPIKAQSSQARTIVLFPINEQSFPFISKSLQRDQVWEFCPAPQEGEAVFLPNSRNPIEFPDIDALADKQDQNISLDDLLDTFVYPNCWLSYNWVHIIKSYIDRGLHKCDVQDVINKIRGLLNEPRRLTPWEVMTLKEMILQLEIRFSYSMAMSPDLGVEFRDHPQFQSLFKNN